MKLYIFLQIILLVGLMILFSFLFDNTLVAGLVSYAIWITLMLLRAKMIRRRANQWSNLLTENCDPIAFLQLGEHYLDRKRFHPIFTKLNICSGLIGSGRFDEAYQLLLTLDARKGFFKLNSYKLVYYSNLFNCFVALNKLNEATHLFIHVIKPMTVRVKRYVVFKQYLEAQFLSLQGDDETSYNMFKEVLNNFNQKNAYVACLYNLGKLEEKKGLIKEAKHKYEEVIEQGNKLYVVTKAKESLRLLNE